MELHFFLGCVGFVIIVQFILLIKYFASLVIGFFAYVIREIGFSHISAAPPSIVSSSEVSTDSLSGEPQIDSAKEGYINIREFSVVSKMSKAGASSPPYEQNDSDDNNIGKNIAGLAISEAIAVQLPSDFFSCPSKFALQRICYEAAIVSVILSALIPLVFNEALTIVFTLYYLCKFIISLADELIYYVIEDYKEREKEREKFTRDMMLYKLGNTLATSALNRLRQDSEASTKDNSSDFTIFAAAQKGDYIDKTEKKVEKQMVEKCISEEEQEKQLAKLRDALRNFMNQGSKQN